MKNRDCCIKRISIQYTNQGWPLSFSVLQCMLAIEKKKIISKRRRSQQRKLDMHFTRLHCTSKTKQKYDFLRSFMSVRNNNVPSTDFCGTPEVTWEDGDVAPSQILVRKDSIQDKRFPWLPKSSSFSSSFISKRWFGTLWKALEKSNRTAWIDLFCCRELAVLWILSISWSSVDLFDLKPCWHFVSTL